MTHAYQVQARRHGHRPVTTALAVATLAVSGGLAGSRAVWPDAFAFNIVILMAAVTLAAAAWKAATSAGQRRNPPTR